MIDVARFFDRVSSVYSEAIRRSNPCYDAMLASAFEALPPEFAPRAVLELGAGTGNLTLLLRERWPEAEVAANDVSAEALAECARRAAPPLVRTVLADMAVLDFAPGSFDLIASSLAVHHLDDGAKRRLCEAAARWLRPGGWLVVCDRFRDASPHLADLHRRVRREHAFAHGATEEMWAQWGEHERAHDRPCALGDLLGWLGSAGFECVDCVWRRYMWGTAVGRRA